MIEVELPDGRVLEIDAPDAQSAAAAAQKFLANQQQQPQPQAPVAPQQPDQRWGWQKFVDDKLGLQTLKDATQGVGQGLTLGFGDEMFAAGLTPVVMAKRAIRGDDAGKGFGERVSNAYSAALANERTQNKEAYERSPIAHTVGEITGGVMTAGNLAKSGVTLLNAAKPTMANMALRGAGEGAAYGLATGFGRGEGFEDRKNQAVLNALIGAGTGAATGGISGWLANNAAKKTIPSAADLKTQATAAYKSAENAGVVFQPQRYATAVDDWFTSAANRGLDPTLTPNSVAAFKRLEELKGIPLSLQTLEQQRKILNNASKLAASSKNSADEAIANSAIRKLDAFVQDNTNVLFSGGNPDAAAKALQEARGLWRRAAKSEQIADVLSRAEIRSGQYSQSGMENALRTEFRQIAMNPKKLRGFTDAEQAAIKKVATGGSMENILRLAGKFAIRGPISGGVVAGTAAMNPTAAAALALAGEVAKRGAGRMTINNAKMVDALIRSGGQLPAGNISQAQKLIIDSLLANQHLAIPRQPQNVR
jgi:hypothetical protein